MQLREAGNPTQTPKQRPAALRVGSNLPTPENPSRLTQVLLLVGVIDVLAIIVWAVLTFAR